MIALALFFLLIWLATAALAGHRLRTILPLAPDAADGRRTGRISVIVPARDEERDIEPAMRSILAQQGVDLEVIAVNDHSRDRTGPILDRLAAADPRLRVVHDPVLAQGWLGKANAMRAGLERAANELILFSDADIVHHPRCFWAALSELQRFRLDMVSALPRVRVRLFWEHAMLPMLVAGAAKLVPERRQMDPGLRDAAGSGALMLVKREALDRLGGLQPIRGEMADDMALARAVKKAGFRPGYRLAPELMAIELFKTNRDAFSGTTKNILLVIEESLWLAPLLPVFSFMLLGFPLVLAGWGAWRGDARALLVGLGAYAAQYATLYVLRRQFSFRPLAALAFPLSAVIVSWCATRAFLLRLRGRISWRGRVLPMR
jgi:glycosyltransferase involved in cell wall biosynthesis